MARLSLEGVHLQFGGVATLAGVSLEVHPQNFLAIIGSALEPRQRARPGITITPGRTGRRKSFREVKFYKRRKRWVFKREDWT